MPTEDNQESIEQDEISQNSVEETPQKNDVQSARSTHYEDVEANVAAHVDNIENVQITNKSFLDYLPYLSQIIISFIGISLLLGIGYALFLDKTGNNTILKIGDASVARGVITFLIVIVTIGIAVILTLSAALSNSPDFKERFALGKEILTILIGVLGTIVGYYFGSAENNPKIDSDQAAIIAAQTPQISPPNLSNGQVTDETGTIITSFINGGKSPYKYKIIFEPANLIADITGESKDGIIRTEEIKKPTPEKIKNDTEVTYQIEVTDADNKTVTLTKDKTKKFMIKGP